MSHTATAPMRYAFGRVVHVGDNVYRVTLSPNKRTQAPGIVRAQMAFALHLAEHAPNVTPRIVAQEAGKWMTWEYRARA